jgi:anti-sigma B factor antagonist
MEQELPQFALTVRRRGDRARVALLGELDLHGADEVRSAAAALLDAGVRRLDLDAAELAFVDSSGLKALLDIRHDALARGVEVTVVAASQRLRWVVEVTGAGDLLPISG